MINRARNTLFILFALLAAVAAIYHFIGIFYAVNSSPVWRHALFVVIDLICVYGLLKRPPWFTWAFAILLLQQLYSHGSDIGWRWKQEHHVDWVSIAVVVLLPLMFILLLIEKRSPEKR